MLSMARAGLWCAAALAVSDAIAVHPDRRWAWGHTCQAMKEAGLHCQNVSVFGNMANKFEESALKCVFAVRRATGGGKAFRYNFQGKLENSRSERIYRARRKWVIDFARAHFTDSDVLRVSSPMGFGFEAKNHSLLGPFDKTGAYDPRAPNKFAECSTMLPGRELYLRLMSQSTFTLCPGGDYPFSNRFWEAIVAGSIPVIHSMRDDFGSSVSRWAHQIGYKYFTTQEVLAMDMSAVDLQRVADANQEKLIKYQTFMFGDQIPPGTQKADTVLCAASHVCMHECSKCK